MSEDVLVSKKDRVATITFNRPEVGNAFSKEAYLQTREYIEQLGEAEDVGAIVLTGAGKHFSAGGDIRRFKGLIESGEFLQKENIRNAGALAAAIHRCPKPTVAMINGAAAGAGCAVALACDFRIVTAKSKLIMSFIKMGLPGDTCGMYSMQRLIGTAKTIELMMTGDPVGGEDAVCIGLASKLVEADMLEQEAMAFARKLAGAPLMAIRRQKEMIAALFYADLEQVIEQEAENMVSCSHTADFKEAVDAFLEKRTPIFHGK